MNTEYQRRAADRLGFSSIGKISVATQLKTLLMEGNSTTEKAQNHHGAPATESK